MTASRIEQLSDAILHEGYLLFPYRPSAMKNRMRWTFGAICPKRYAEASGGTEAWQSRAECLIESETTPTITARLRFLQVRPSAGGDRSWQEGVTRDVAIPKLSLNSTWPPHLCSFGFEGSGENSEKTQNLKAAKECGVEGSVAVAANAEEPGLLRISLTITNTKFLENASQFTRDEAMMHSLVSAHLILEVDGGSFISLLDPLPQFSEAASHCHNVGLFPILAGERGDLRTMLASPIILYDYPQIAPESEGDLFDSTEIDEFLILQIMALSDEEKAQMRACDERARKILDRIEARPEHLEELHGAQRASS